MDEHNNVFTNMSGARPVGGSEVAPAAPGLAVARASASAHLEVSVLS